MSQEYIQTPLWKDGRNGNIQFLSSWARLEKEDKALYDKITQREGFECEITGFHYKVGMSRYGLWLSKKQLPTVISDKTETETTTETTTAKKIGIVTAGNESKAIEITLLRQLRLVR